MTPLHWALSALPAAAPHRWHRGFLLGRFAAALAACSALQAWQENLGDTGFIARHSSGSKQRGSGAEGWGRLGLPTAPAKHRHLLPSLGAIPSPGATRTGGCGVCTAPYHRTLLPAGQGLGFGDRLELGVRDPVPQPPFTHPMGWGEMGDAMVASLPSRSHQQKRRPHLGTLPGPQSRRRAEGISGR